MLFTAQHKQLFKRIFNTEQLFFANQMIKKRSLTNGVQANLSLEPQAAAQSTSNINNNIIINKRENGTEEIVITRNVELEEKQPEEDKDVRNLILQTYAQILLDQDKALISNLISKNCIIVPVTALQEIIKAILKAEQVEIYLDEDMKCCAKVSPIRKIEAIKIVKDSGEVVTDFKQVNNKEWNELVNKYHLSLKFAVNG